MTDYHSRVLLVEPPTDDRDMYAEYLRACGFDVVLVETADGALAQAPGVDVIVTAVQLPGLDGLELVRHLRGQEATKETPIVVLTTCTFEPERERARAAGCNAFLPKPCLPDDLVAELRRVIKDSRHARALGELSRISPTAAAMRPEDLRWREDGRPDASRVSGRDRS